MGQFTASLSSFSVSVFYSLYLFFELLFRTKSRCFLPLLKESPLRLIDSIAFCFHLYHTLSHHESAPSLHAVLSVLVWTCSVSV